MTRRSEFRPPDVFLRRGLRTNPFCKISHAELAELIEPEPWLRALAERAWSTLMLVGESGRGKTSAAHLLMELLRDRVGEIRYQRLDERRPRLPRRGRAGLVVVDSAQWLRPRQRRRLPRWLRGGRSVLVGQEDVTAGLGVEVVRVTPPPPSPQELERWYERRLSEACLPGRRGPALTPEARAMILRWCRGNRMRVQELLYETFERLAEGREVIDVACLEAGRSALRGDAT